MSRERRADFIRAKVPQARVDRMWEGTLLAEARLRQRGRVLPLASAAGVIAAAAACYVLVLGNRESPLHVVERPAEVLESPRQMTLPDGTALRLDASSRAEVLAASPEGVRVRADRGKVDFDMPEGKARRVLVLAGLFEIEAHETRFSVERSERRVVVQVERGVAEVRDGDHQLLASLHAGQSWTSEESSQPAPADSSAQPAPSVKPKAVSSAVAESAHERSARRLFEQADGARLAGQSAKAAALFDQLRKRYPDDPRAGYAAFQVGRIELDTLGRPRAAAQAFAFAMNHPGPGFFQEDAEARYVEALARAGDVAACRRAREAFLARHPRSAHAQRIGATCSGP